MRRWFASVALTSLCGVGLLYCGTRTEPGGALDAGMDGAADAGQEHGPDAGHDAGRLRCQSVEDCVYGGDCQKGYCCDGYFDGVSCYCGDAAECDLLHTCCTDDAGNGVCIHLGVNASCHNWTGP